MQQYNNLSIIAKNYGGKALAAVYHGLLLVWIAVRSCFGSGVWVNEKPWLNDEGWNNG